MLSAQRAEVLADYNAAVLTNYRKFIQGDNTATSEYIYDNQINDAIKIVQEFKDSNCRVISITKKTKIGMDGLMIEIAMRMTTDPDDAFVTDAANIRIITGMSNVSWQKDMKAKSPNCFKDKIFHHGQLKNANLHDLRNALIIIDEIDTGNKEYQILHRALHNAGLLSIQHMEQRNIRFIFVSATMIKELYNLDKWISNATESNATESNATVSNATESNHLCKRFQMTIPPNYIGHSDFLERGILQEFYPLVTDEAADKWIKEDILINYGNDYRIHIVRVNNATLITIRNACRRNNVQFYNHTADDRLNENALKKLFTNQTDSHIVIGIKGFFRRANLIPNAWKLRIGATHEYIGIDSKSFKPKIADNSVQIQGLPGRMSGYWREAIDGGHKTGPHRTSLQSVKEYEETYADPFGTTNSYRCAGFTKKEGVVTKMIHTMLSSRNIEGLKPEEKPKKPEKPEKPEKPKENPEENPEENPDLIQEKSKPIIIIKLDSADKFRKPDFRRIFQRANNSDCSAYKKYKLGFWRADTKAKCRKWGIYEMKQLGAYSCVQNIPIKDQDQNILMVYQHEDELIVAPWNGKGV